MWVNFNSRHQWTDNESAQNQEARWTNSPLGTVKINGDVAVSPREEGVLISKKVKINNDK